MADFSFSKKEEKILNFWRDHKVFEKSLELRKKAKHFVFFEGPPTANGRPGIHHFLGRAFKDLFCRYKTMRGFYVLRKAGWDTHGLPVELEVEKELGIKNKKEIEIYGIEKFNKKAKESVWKYKKEWEDMTKKMGFWLDDKDPYITYENNYIESLWNVIKQIWNKKLLYLAHRVVPFCVRCGTPLSSHEVAQGYRTITDLSVIVKFPIINFQFPKNGNWKLETGNSKTYILAWTTTPWTLPGNVALAVGKDIEYSLVGVGDEVLLLATDLVDKVFGKPRRGAVGEPTEASAYEILDTKYKGSDLVGLEYEPLFDIKKLESDSSYKIYDADFVSTTDGTGVVHTAVMYGEDDYNLGTKVGLPKFHTVDEQGRFISDVPAGLAGLYVKDKKTEDLVIESLKSKNLIFKVEDFEHDYPFCWRCSTPLLYYAKDSWFIKMSAVNKDLLKNNQKINWIPEHIKEGRFGQWIKEGKDWAFSRERYWGTPLPVWKCIKCSEYKVAGSIEDLEKYRFGSKNKFYALRHGHSTKNGYEDKPPIISSFLEHDKYHLTEEGKKDALEAAKRLKKLGGVDLIISSPFLRTKETAEIVGKELGVEVVLDDRIAEFKHGSLCEGKEHHACGLDIEEMKWEEKTLDGESWKELWTRMAKFLRDTDSLYDGKKILIVSHGDPLLLLEGFTLNYSGQEIIDRRNRLFPKEGELREIDLKNYPYDSEGNLDLHRPYIDKISLKCESCKSEMKKVPDLIDVWFDSGAMPYAQWHMPFENEEMFKNQFPGDFIVEGIDQTRGWFYTLLAISTLLGNGAPYKNVMSLSHVLDDKGQKMSKSKGNVVSPFDVMEKFGADPARWYFYTMNSPGDYKLFSERDVQGKLVGFISTLQNCVRFYELYKLEDNYELRITNSMRNPKSTNGELNLLDKWIYSRLNSLIKEVTEGLDKYEVTQGARAIEKFVIEDLSNWWLRRSRKRKEAMETLRKILLEVAKLIAPFVPFSAEDLHSRLHAGQNAETESVHLHNWPKVNTKAIDVDLEGQMSRVQEIVTRGLAIRKEKQIKVRQPLRSVILASVEFPSDLEGLIGGELNVKQVVYDKSQRDLVGLDIELDQALIFEGYARELIRQIQDMRKEAGYKMNDQIFGQWYSADPELSAALTSWSLEIEKEALIKSFKNQQDDDKTFDVEKEFDLVSQKKIWVGIKR